MICAMSESVLRYELRRPVVEELRRIAPLIAVVIILASVLWLNADDVSRRFAEFWRLDQPELPAQYWWGVWFLAIAWVAVSTIVMIVRVRREPVLTIGPERIVASYSTSSVRGVDTSRVSEIHLTNTELRFHVHDGLAPRVPVRLLVGATGVQAAQDIANRMNVPAYRVTGPRRSKEPLGASAESTSIG